MVSRDQWPGMMPPPTKLNSSSFLLFACYCLQLSQLSNGYRGHKLRTHSFSSHFYEAWQCGWCQWLLLGLQFVELIGSPVIIMLILLQTKLFMQTKLRKQCTALSVVAGANVNYKLTVGVKWVTSYNPKTNICYNTLLLHLCHPLRSMFLFLKL